MTTAAADETTSLPHRVALDILKEIEAGDYPAGDRLPSEQALAERHGVSRPSLREALSALEFAGYVESRRGYGTVVLPVTTRHVARKGPDRSQIDPVDLIEARLAIEPEAIRLAAMEPHAADLKEARSMLDGMWLAVEAAGSLRIGTDIAVHLAIVRMCPNVLVRNSALMLLDAINPPDWADARKDVWSDSKILEGWAVEHEAVLSAVQARQPERAARCSRRHLLTTIRSLAERDSVGPRDRRRLTGLLNRSGDVAREDLTSQREPKDEPKERPVRAGVHSK